MTPVIKQNTACRQANTVKTENHTLLMIFDLIITRYIEFEWLMIASQFLIFVHLRNVNAQSIFALECFLAMVTFVAEMTREVNAFNVIP